MASNPESHEMIEEHSKRPPHHKSNEDDESEVAPEAIGGPTSDFLPPGYYRSPNFIGTVIALCLGNCACYLGWVLPANTLALINEDIGPDPNINWVALVWTLSVSVAFLVVGRLSDLLGRRWFFVGGNFIGLIGTIVGGTAKSIPTLIGANCLTGIAAAVQLSFAVVISELVPNKYRGYCIGGLFFSSMPFAAFGPVIARSFILHTAAGWRWSYYLNIIVSGITVVLFYLFYHPPTYSMLHMKHSKKDILKMMDFGGLALFTGGLVLFLIGLSWGGTVHPWKSGLVIGFIVGGAMILVLFVLYELYVVKEYQLVPMHLFKNRPFVGTILTAAIGSSAYYSLNILWPIQISVLYETDVLQIGWWSCIIGSGAVIGQSLCGALVKRIGKQRWQMVASMIILTSFLGGMAGVTASTPSMALGFTVITSVALGYVESVAFTIAPFCIPPKHIGLALGLLGCVRSSIASVATAVFVSVLNNKLETNVPKYVIPAATSAGLPASSAPDLLVGFTTGNFTGVPGVTPAIIAAASVANQKAYSESFKVVYLAAVAFGAVGILAALNSQNSEHFFTTDISRRLHGGHMDDKGNDVQKKEDVLQEDV